VSTRELTLADALVGEAVVFFSALEKSQRGELTLAEVDERIDLLAIIVQSLDVAGGNPDTWSEHLVAPTSSYEHLWPAERILLFLLANYGALHAVLRNDAIELPLIAPESIAREILVLEWVAQETTAEDALAAFLAHPASQVPEQP
jgi:hypothetical protein